MILAQHIRIQTVEILLNTFCINNTYNWNQSKTSMPLSKSEMVDSCLDSIKNICGLLDRIETWGLDDPSYSSKADHALVIWIQLFAQSMIAFLKALLSYTSGWRRHDTARYLASLLADIEDALRYKEAKLEADCASGETWCWSTKSDRIQKIRKFICSISEEVGDASDALAKADHRPMKHPFAFDEFVASVQAYLESLPAQLNAYVCPGLRLNVIQYNREPYLRESAPYQVWPSSKVNETVAVVVRNLEILRHLIACFARCCFDDREKLYPVLNRAGALVFSIAHLSWASVQDRDADLFINSLFSTLSDLSDKISNHNLEVNEIYLKVLEGHEDLLKAAKPSPGSIGSPMVDKDMTNCFLSFILSANERADLMYSILKFPLIDITDTPEDCRDHLIELSLKRGIAAVKKAICLDQSIWDDEMPNGPVTATNSWLKMKLIRAEIFLQALNNHKADLVLSVGNQISAVAAVSKALRLLAKFYRAPDSFLEDSKRLILSLIEDAIREPVSIYYSNQTGSTIEDIISETSVAVFEIFKAEATLMVLIDHEASLAFLASHRIESLHKVLNLLRALLSNLLKVNLEDGNLSISLRALASEAAFFVCSFGHQRAEENTNLIMNLLLPCLPEMNELNMADTTQLYQPSPWSLFSNSPKSSGFGFLGLLLGELRGILNRKPDIIAVMQDQAQVFMKELQLAMSQLQDVAEQLDDNTDLGRRLMCLIYEAEYIIDLSVTGGVPMWQHQLGFLNLVLETRFIKAQVLELYEKKKVDFAAANVEVVLQDMSVEDTTSLKIEEVDDQARGKIKLSPKDDEVIVGVDDQAQIIINQLKSRRQQLDIVSIVGMPGLGKTTLARKVYGDVAVGYHFEIRGWCSVSQVYRKRELILEILGSFVELTDKIMKMDDGDLSTTLYQALKKRRFLIVMDDVWTIEPWNDLKCILPDDGKGSRVLFTTRLSDVPLQGNPTREPHQLRLLTDDESWMLLLDRVFQGGSCPEELLKVARQIATACKGLPLAIVVVAGLLRGRIGGKGCWNEIAGSLRSHLRDDPNPNEQFMHILEKSYNHLPCYLRPCFLYMGAFLEDTEISVQKLKLYWKAEGFVSKAESESLEETAEKYMAELIGRSLVMETKRRSKGGTKACRMHDMVRDLCLEKARSENFMHLVVSGDDKDGSKKYSHLFNGTLVQYRLCVHSIKEAFVGSLPVAAHAHSLLLLPIDNRQDLGGSYDFAFIVHKFKLLRMLDLESITFRGTNFPTEIELMIRLRYLAIRGKMSEVPSSIAKLWNLETLIVRGTHGEIALPAALWTMERLSQVQVLSRASFTLPGNDESTVSANLSVLSSAALPYGKDTEKLLRLLVGLKKLRCIFFENWDISRKCNLFPGMDFMTQLESLKIFYYGRILFPCEFNFPINLKKLTLSKFRLPWEYISAIRELPNLEVLKLLSRAFEGETWDLEEGDEFPNLKFFMLDGLNLTTWSALSDNFPQLERLVLRSCKKLEEIPSSFGEISTLQMIEVHWCSESSAKSVGTIHDQQLDYGNAGFKVMISPPHWDFRASSK
ncbi:OLC1v1020764C1 [Oldenlandia corymbosa var. corymbosa]|uniref:OLC1v1020764C1 n=1 Tax=Oldenlandia corymbosa var. corymbosa TaxID=529605 RepID=A0AAV1BU67_OLDCO|nr:OLC1v1020764C1 [Oldenlandia corymbosa var. corymbosa]